MGNFNDVQFGSFGDFRDERRGTDQKYSREEVYQPPGSKNRFALHESNGSVTALPDRETRFGAAGWTTCEADRWWHLGVGWGHRHA